MPPGASVSGLLAEEPFREALRELGADPERAVTYRGRVRDRLETYAAPARRLGIGVDFVQAYHHGKLVRFLLIHDPSLPEAMTRTVRMLGTVDWQTAMTEAGLLAAPRERKPPPGRYVECPDCEYDNDLGLTCPTCKGKGLVSSSDDS